VAVAAADIVIDDNPAVTRKSKVQGLLSKVGPA
jgi:hypothetical protein